MNQQITKYRVQVVNQDREFFCSSENNLLVGMERDNTECIDVGCRGGGCGVCKVRIVEGDFSSKRMSKAHITEQDRDEGFVLACRIFPTSDLKIEADLTPESLKQSLKNKN
ncbi:2Fe-2S iron-sulfur cluster binding domain-containing protein [Neptuniibacter sp.]|uniref:2Fe-2S iron-sulfur cluster binding domain-containing protein n=1 Tax=Neptuniibacter sp. TaxID=1962643 RepID=UPI00262BB039|nr:2Fe-2S iron-sulfur cluster binding domain-containing protein [Neptuniibacter sp.]MCP4597132.1 2Fe-2S iron-sulfur cluster binding domain-containing protein [Neptuniibacter sp.]